MVTWFYNSEICMHVSVILQCLVDQNGRHNHFGQLVVHSTSHCGGCLQRLLLSKAAMIDDGEYIGQIGQMRSSNILNCMHYQMPLSPSCVSLSVTFQPFF